MTILHMTWVYLMHSKSKVLHVFLAFYIYVNVHFRASIRSVQSNNAFELSFSSFYIEKGIQTYQVCVEAPQ